MRFAIPVRTIGGLLVGALAAVAPAQDLAVKAPPQKDIIALVGATVHPVVSPAIEGGVVWFQNGIIGGVVTGDTWAQLKEAARFSSPVREVDARGKHVWPGMISAYTQLGLTEIQAVRQSNDIRETGEVTPEVRATVAVNPDSTLVPVTRANGVLLAGVFPEGGLIPGRGGVIRLEGWTTVDMTAREVCGVAVRWPSVRPVSAWWMDRSEEDQMKEIRASVARVEQVFDSARAYAAQRDADPASPIDLRWEAMRGLWPAKGEGLPLFVSAGDVDQITSAVSFAGERGLRCVIVGGRDAPACAELLKKHRASVIVRGTFTMPRRGDSPYDDGYALPARLRAAGIPFAIGTGDDTAHERNLPYNAAMAAAHGLTVDDALAAITLWPAEILGIADRYGSLGEGKSATLIVTDGNPLEVTTRTEMAFIDGRRVDLSSKHSVLAEKYRERYRQQGERPR